MMNGGVDRLPSVAPAASTVCRDFARTIVSSPPFATKSAAKMTQDQCGSRQEARFAIALEMRQDTRFRVDGVMEAGLSDLGHARDHIMLETP